jgi:hypothetical protein
MTQEIRTDAEWKWAIEFHWTRWFIGLGWDPVPNPNFRVRLGPLVIGVHLCAASHGHEMKPGA